MTVEMSVRGTLALIILINPSAGTGRQDELKLRWYNIVEVQVLFRIDGKQKIRDIQQSKKLP